MYISTNQAVSSYLCHGESEGPSSRYLLIRVDMFTLVLPIERSRAYLNSLDVC